MSQELPEHCKYTASAQVPKRAFGALRSTCSEGSFGNLSTREQFGAPGGSGAKSFFAEDIDQGMARQMQGGYPTRRAWINLHEHPMLPDLWEIMTSCWQEELSKRPSAKVLLSRLEPLNQNPVVFSALGVDMLPA